jgi:oxygen-dependent protoporphyrinogen oxidase
MTTPIAEAAPDVLIIGGGIAGLAAAHTLRKNGVSSLILEQGARAGGKLLTEPSDGFTIESGPDAFLMRKPWAYQLAQELGLAAQIIHPRREHARTYIVRRGQLYPLPDGFNLIAPSKLWPFLQSPLLSLGGRARALLDWFIPPESSDDDESVGAFVTRRLGRETADVLADPLLGGVFNAPINSLSLAASFPQFRQLEKMHGSVIRGLMRVARTPKLNTPAFFSFIGGAQTLVDALASRLSDVIQTNAALESLTRADEVYQARLASGQVFSAPSVILATPPAVSARLLRDIAPDSSRRLRQIKTTDVGVAALGYKLADIPRKLDGFGVVIPSVEKRPIDGMTWASAKWSHRAPDGHALIRVFFGGVHTHQTFDLSNSDLLSVIRGELRELLGITAPPVITRLTRWPSAYPLYEVGHLERTTAIESGLPDGICLTGSGLYGVGVPDVVHHAQQTAQKITEVIHAHA